MCDAFNFALEFLPFFCGNPSRTIDSLLLLLILSWFSFASLDTLLILFCFSWYSLDSLLLLLILLWFSFASLDTLLILFCFSWYSFDSPLLLFILSWFNESTFKGLRRNYQGDSVALESFETVDVSHNEFCVRVIKPIKNTPWRSMFGDASHSAVLGA